MNRVILVYFSPTHTTRKILHGIAEGIQVKEVIEVDLTTSSPNMESLFERDDLILIGTPVYGGRVPTTALEKLNTIQGKGQPVVCVSMYGNNSYGNALKELTVTAERIGFVPVAGAGFIGEHSFSNEKRKIAHGRPNVNDLQIAKSFGQKIEQKLRTKSIEELKTQSIGIPGKFVEKAPMGMPKMASKAKANCRMCLKCTEVCPMSAIDERAVCDKDKCIHCFACVKECPENARELKHPLLSIASFVLSQGKYKEPKLFL